MGEIDNEVYVPSVDVCAWCGDIYCDGVGCIASIDPDDPEQHDALDELHRTIRAGKVWLQADKILARAENRAPESWGKRDNRFLTAPGVNVNVESE